MNPYLIFLFGGFVGLALAGGIAWAVGAWWARALSTPTVITSLPFPVVPTGGTGASPPPRPALPAPRGWAEGPTLVRHGNEPILVVRTMGDVAAVGWLFGERPTWGRA